MKFRIPLCLASFALVASTLHAQKIPSLVITPSTANVPRRSSHVFRAVDRDGHRELEVRWSISSSSAEIDGTGPEVDVYFKEPGEYSLRAYSPSGSAEARIKVIDSPYLPAGSVKWTVSSFEGCKTQEIKAAIPAPGSDNDVFMLDNCAQGTVVRAFTAEGMENWRTWISGEGVDVNNLESYAPKSLLGSSVCDGVKIGMTRENAWKIVTDAKIALTEADRVKDSWLVEQATASCKIDFDHDLVAKKKRTITN
jgi:hypothetical protein